MTETTEPGATQTRRAFVACPSYSGKPTDQTLYTNALFQLEAEGLGWGYRFFPWGGDAFITHARNACVGKFLESDCTDLIFLDDDVGAGPGVFTRLMSHRVHFVAGVYRTKQDQEQYMVRFLPGEVRTDPKTDLLEVECVPFGLVRLSRECVEAMVKKHKSQWFMSHLDRTLKCWNLFDIVIEKNRLWGEDFVFCRKWRAMGGKVWVDWDLPTVHVNGEGRVFRGHLGNWIRKKSPCI